MDYRLMHAAFNACTGSASTKSVLLCICAHANDTGDGETFTAWPSVATLSEKTELNRKTVMDSVKKLSQMPFFSVEVKSGKGNIYTVNLPSLTSTKNGTGTEIGTSTEKHTVTSTKNGTGTSPKNGTAPVPKTGHKDNTKRITKEKNEDKKITPQIQESIDASRGTFFEKFVNGLVLKNTGVSIGDES